jgi:RIO kinase 2
LVNKRLLLSASTGTLGYQGYRLTFAGYDSLALNALVKRNVVEALGPPLGLGKESDVYSAKGRNGADIALKFHRLGRISFRQTRRTRRYVADRLHTSWIYQARIAATRECAAMKRVLRAGVEVPKSIDNNRHIVAMGMFLGSELRVSALTDPAATLRRILLSMRKMYRNARIVHGDLSEYNILVAESEDFTIIDWPQSVARNDPRSKALLTRDVANIVGFFARKHNVQVPLKTALEFIQGKRKRFSTIQ